MPRSTILLMLGAFALACGTSQPDKPPMPASSAAAALTIRELYAREGDDIVHAPEKDQAVAQTYARAPHGSPRDGYRLTIMTARTRYAVGETVRVIHVVEAETGHPSYVMGPKTVYGEYVDGKQRTPDAAAPDYPWLAIYDGRVIDGPDADVNFEVTTYRFAEPGAHTIEWRIGPMQSNRIELDVTR